MGKLLALDYGARRCGLAETDDMQIIASSLTTVNTTELMSFLEKYLKANKVDALIVGEPVRMDGSLSEIEHEIRKFITKFAKQFPGVEVIRVNEMFSSKMALDSMIMGGSTRKQRREKGNIDKVAATLILQNYLEIKRNQR